MQPVHSVEQCQERFRFIKPLPMAAAMNNSSSSSSSFFSSSSPPLATHTSLRWRSRVTQQVIASAMSSEEKDNPAASHKKLSYFSTTHRFTHCRRVLSLVVTSLILTSASFYALLYTTPRSWRVTLTVTCQVAVAVILFFQASVDSHTKRIPLYQQRIQALKRQRTVLREKIRVQTKSLQNYQPRLRQVNALRKALQEQTHNTTVEATLQTQQELYHTVYPQLQACCQAQVLYDVMKALFSLRQQNETSKNYTTLTPHDVDCIKTVFETSKDSCAVSLMQHDEVTLETFSDVVRMILAKQKQNSLLQWHPETLASITAKESVS